MKATGNQVIVFICSIVLLTSCANISLSGGKTGGNAGPKPASGTNTGGVQTQQAQGSAIPPLDGEWEVDYEFKGQAFVGNVQLAQQGNALVGDGTDQDGKQWSLENGQIQGTQVSFQKKYANSANAITYTGELKHEQSADYTGWLMEGTYSSPGKDGAAVSGKWVANPTSPLQEAAAPVAAPPPSQPLNPFPPSTSQPQQQQASTSEDVQPVDISGRYEGSYTYDFKKISTKMWLRNDGKKISGDGVDVTGKTSVRFTIPKGWYDYPKVTIVRQYTKGQGAQETRSMTFKAKLSSNGRDITMKGETQYGGAWDAHLVR